MAEVGRSIVHHRRARSLADTLNVPLLKSARFAGPVTPTSWIFRERASSPGDHTVAGQMCSRDVPRAALPNGLDEGEADITVTGARDGDQKDARTLTFDFSTDSIRRAVCAACLDRRVTPPL